MCGIAGIASNEKNKILEISTLLKYLKNRGPDASKIFNVNDKLVLGHTRLSIIDINDRSSQPMLSRSKRNIIAFNGEIYNYKELKKQFFNNFIFRTNGDTEVLVEGIEKYGFEFLNNVRGFYSFAVYNYEKNTIFLAKDLFGKKPLFYHHHKSEFYFSSDLHGLADLIKKNNSTNINHFGLTHYFWKGYFHEENTIYKDIKSVIPGEILELNLNNNVSKKLKKDNSLKFNFNNTNLSREENIEKLFSESLDYRKVSDVEISYLLSGGVDSSLICKFASNNEKINTFYVKNEKEKNVFDDLSSKVSDIIGSNHNSLEVGELNLDDILKFVC